MAKDSVLYQSHKNVFSVIREYVTGTEEEAILARAPLADEKGIVPANPAWSDDLCFFGSWDLRIEALKKSLGHELISGNIPAAELLLAENPWLFDEVVSSVDHCDRRLTEKPIAFVARLYDFNPRQPEEKEEDFGAVERLSKIAIEKGRRTSDQIAVEVDEVLPCHWDTMTDERMEHYGLDPKRWGELSNQHEFPWQAIAEKHMQKYKDACENLVNDLAVIDIPADADLLKDIPIVDISSDEIRREMIWQQTLALPEVKAAALRFQTAVGGGDTSAAGLVFDPAIFPWFINRFWGIDGQPAWKNKLDGAWARKSHLLGVLGYGGLIHNDTACGQQVHKKGIYFVTHKNIGKMPDRAVNHSEGVPASLAGVGDFEILNLFGSGCWDRRWSGGKEACAIFETYVEQKQLACHGVCRAAEQRSAYALSGSVPNK